MNSFTITISNCLDCQDHVVLPIYTEDSWDHEEGCYCTLCKGKNGRPKLVGGDDWHLRDYTDIPDWCPKIMEVVTDKDDVIVETRMYKSK